MRRLGFWCILESILGRLVLHRSHKHQSWPLQVDGPICFNVFLCDWYSWVYRLGFYNGPLPPCNLIDLFHFHFFPFYGGPFWGVQINFGWKQNCWMNFFIRPRHSRVWIFVHHFEFSLKTADLAARLLLSCAHNLPPGGRIWLLFYRKFINCLLKHCEIWQKGQFKH